MEIRDLARRQFSCDCVDYRVNGLGTCKHVEAVLDQLENGLPTEYAATLTTPSLRIDLVPDRTAQTLRLERGLDRLPRALRRIFDQDGRLATGYLPEMALEMWKTVPLPELRVSQEVAWWLECRRRENRRADPPPHLRTKCAIRGLASAGNAPAVVSVSARRNVAPRLCGTGAARR